MKKWYFMERNYRTLRESVIPTKKAPQKVLFIKWCAILCDYRTNFYDEYKKISDKFVLFDEILKNTK